MKSSNGSVPRRSNLSAKAAAGSPAGPATGPGRAARAGPPRRGAPAAGGGSPGAPASLGQAPPRVLTTLRLGIAKFCQTLVPQL